MDLVGWTQHMKASKRNIVPLFTCALLIALIGKPAPSASAEAKIYVIKEADGALRFTNKPPLAGQSASVFSSKGRYYRTPSPSRLASGEILYGRARASYRVASSPLYRIRGVRNTKTYRNVYAGEIQRNAKRFDVDSSLIRAVIHAESSFNRYAVSPKGAEGLMQLMPATAQELGVSDSFNPAENIRGGVKYLSQLIKRLGSETLAVAAYNAGEVPVRKYGGIPPYSETQAYVKRVLRLKKQYSLSQHG